MFTLNKIRYLSPYQRKVWDYEKVDPKMIKRPLKLINLLCMKLVITRVFPNHISLYKDRIYGLYKGKYVSVKALFSHDLRSVESFFSKSQRPGINYT